MNLVNNGSGIEYSHCYFQASWLNSLLNSFGSLKVSIIKNGRYSKWVDYHYNLLQNKDIVTNWWINSFSFDESVGIEREVLSNELIFDFDNDAYENNALSCKLLVNRLISKGYTPYIFFSGNKGLHVSVFFNINKLLINHYELINKLLINGLKFKDVLGRYYDYLINDLVFSEQIDKLSLKKSHLIRVVGTINPKSGVPKTFIGYTADSVPLNKSLIKDYQFPEQTITVYEIKQSIFNGDDFIKISNELLLRIVKLNREGVEEQVSLNRFFSYSKNNNDDAQLLNKLLSSVYSDGRKRLIVFLLLPLSVKVYGNNIGKIKLLINDWLRFNDYSFNNIDYHLKLIINKSVKPKYSLIKELKGYQVQSRSVKSVIDVLSKNEGGDVEMPVINLDSNKPKIEFPVFMVEQNYYDAVITAVSDVYSVKDKYNNGPDKERLSITFELKGFTNEQVINYCTNYNELTNKPKSITFNLFVNNVISKGSGKYSNSALYDLLSNAGLLSQLNEDHADNTKFVEFLRAKLVGRECRVNVIIKTTGDGVKYCKLDKNVNFKGIMA